MARKRNSDEMDPEASPARSASTASKDLERELAFLCYETGIELPLRPSDQGYTDRQRKTAARFRVLYFNDRPALRRVQTKFHESCAHLGRVSEDEKIKLLHDLLDEPAKAATPQSQKFRNAFAEPDSARREHEPPSPGSPTKAAKGIGTYFGTTKSKTAPPTTTHPLGPPPIPYDTKPTPPSSQTSNKENVGPRSANTSFATTVANTSFATTANTSFASIFSNVGPSGTQETAASSFHEENGQSQKPESNYMSSISTNEAAELTALLRHAEPAQHSSQGSDETVKPRLPPPPRASPSAQLPSSRESQWTDYGSSLAPSEFDALMADTAFVGHMHTRYGGPDTGMTDVDRVLPNQDNNAAHGKRQGTQSHDLEALQAHTHYLKSAGRAPTPSQPCRSFADLSCSRTVAGLPFALQWEASRAIQSGAISAADLQSRWQPRTLSGLYDLLAGDGISFQKAFDTSLALNFDGLTFGAKLVWSESRSGPLFDIVLERPKKDISSALQRRVGADRVLYMEIPSLQDKPSAHKTKDVSAPFRDFSSRPQTFLGRRWVLYFLQPNKKKGERNTHRAIWVSGSLGTTIVEALQWALPISCNADQRASKAYMRLELQLSRTFPIAKLRPEDIALVKDLTATTHPDDRRFERPECRDQFYERHVSATVMNDGCNKISFWLLNLYAKQKGLSSVPSAMQARIAGSKGVWYIDDEDYRKAIDRPKGPLIWISESQRKVSRDLTAADDEWLCLNVVKQNSGPRPSFLYTAFLPILINGGVSRDAIRKEVHDQVEANTKEFLDALRSTDTIPLRRWMQSTNIVREERNRDAGIPTIGGVPVGREERIIQMLQCGFDPKECKWLAHEVKAMAKKAFDLKSKHFQIRLAQSTTLMGIADPEDCLRPGEVHVFFEKAFLDTVTGRSLLMLDGVDGIVARNPALAAWDIQKVRFVFKPQLARFKNLVVFPSKGMRPLASKLQGGDYDGDTFWLTWSKRLTDDFKNTPAPWEPPPPEHFGIEVDKRPLSYYIEDPQSEQQWCHFLGKMHEIRMLHSANAMLGIVTLELEKLIYAQGTVDSPEARAMLPVHDYMADADKNGYRYTTTAFREWTRKAKIPRNLPEPKYWEFTRHLDPKLNEREKKEKERAVYPAYQIHVVDNITDSVFFDEVKPAIEEALEQVSKILDTAGSYDLDLIKFHDQVWDSAPDGSTIRAELGALKQKLSQVRDHWVTAASKGGTGHDFSDTLRSLRARYNDVMPEDQYSATSIEWLRRQGYGFSTWDLLKASAMAKWQYHGKTKPGQFMFLAAGRELCYLKLMELDSSARFMLLDHYTAHKMRPAPKVERTVDDYDSDGPDDDAVVEDDREEELGRSYW